MFASTAHGQTPPPISPFLACLLDWPVSRVRSRTRDWSLPKQYRPSPAGSGKETWNASCESVNERTSRAGGTRDIQQACSASREGAELLRCYGPPARSAECLRPLVLGNYQSRHRRGQVQGIGLPSSVDGQRLRVLLASPHGHVEARRSHCRADCGPPVLQEQPAVR